MAKKDLTLLVQKVDSGIAQEKAALAVRANGHLSDRLNRAEQIEQDNPEGLAGKSVSAANDKVEGAPVVVGQVIEAPLANVHDNPENARLTYETGDLEEFAEGLKEKGQLVPAPAIPIPGKPGHYMILDGKRRKSGLILAGMPKMRLIITDEIKADDRKALYVLSFRINNERSGQIAIDNAIRWRDLLAEGVFASQDEIVTECKVSKSVVSKTLAMASLDPRVIERMRVNPERFGTYVGYEISLLAPLMDIDQLLKVVERIATEGMSTRQLEDLRAGLVSSSKKSRKEKEQSRQYRAIPSADRPYTGMIREFDSGRIAMDIANIEPDKRARVLEFLRTEFGC